MSEASLLEFPPDALISEKNFNINRDGTADRRLGMDLEGSFTEVGAPFDINDVPDIGTASFVWKNPGGRSEEELFVVQIGKKVYFFSEDANGNISSNLITSYKLSETETTTADFANVDGLLVVVSGTAEISVFDYDGTSVSQNKRRLKIRDKFGVEDILNSAGKDLFSPENLSHRPSALTDQHLYNLRNQSFGIPVDCEGAVEFDPIKRFYEHQSFSKYPSNSDNVNKHMIVFPGYDIPREIFSASDAQDNPPFESAAPRGFFIIDALDRGTSRKEQFDSHYQDNIDKLGITFSGGTGYLLKSESEGGGTKTIGGSSAFPLPKDKTPGGAKTAEEFAGRVFYAGFEGDIDEGDSRSPRLSSYVLFSKLVNDTSDINKCYQESDPSSRDQPDLIATDGGFIRIENAHGIRKLISVGKKLFVIAANGVWYISGESGVGFAADRYEVTRVRVPGTEAIGSVVSVEGSLLYWAEDGIYLVGPNKFGDIEGNNISRDRIQTLYEDINVLDRLKAKAVFDESEGKIRWLYGGQNNSETVAGRELILNATSGGFFTSEINRAPGATSNAASPPSGDQYPRLLDYAVTDPYKIGERVENVKHTDGALVTHTDGSTVTVTTDIREAGTRSVKYLTLTKDTLTVGEPIAQTGNDFSSITLAGHSTAALSSTRIALAETSSNQLITLDWDGTNFTEVGTRLTIAGMGNPTIVALSSTRIAFVDSSNAELRAYDYNTGTGTWSLTGTGLAISVSTSNGIGKLTSSRVVFVRGNSGDAFIYDFDGTNWTLTDQDSLDITVGGFTALGNTAVASLTSTKFVVINASEDLMSAHEYTGGVINHLGTEYSLSSGFQRELVGLNATQVVVITPKGGGGPVNLGTFTFDGAVFTDDGNEIEVEASLSGNNDGIVDVELLDTGKLVTSVQTYPIKVFNIREINPAGEDQIYFSFGSYKDSTFTDYPSYHIGTGAGADAAGELITGYILGDDIMRVKQAPYGVFHFIRTEDGYDDSSGSIEYSNPSSCKVQARWEWANSANSGRWGDEFQAYRYGRYYIPSGVGDSLDYGFPSIVTKNKIRGKGRALNFRIRTEAEKDCRILGWGLLMTMEENV